jgi:hypothetical protein
MFTRRSRARTTPYAPVLSQGNRKKLSTITLAIAFALAPLAAHATAQRHHALHHPHAAVSAAATALVPAVKFDDNSDGLSRNREECNRGSIDN